jgi:hypothetical protein
MSSWSSHLEYLSRFLSLFAYHLSCKRQFMTPSFLRKPSRLVPYRGRSALTKSLHLAACQDCYPPERSVLAIADSAAKVQPIGDISCVTSRA